MRPAQIAREISAVSAPALWRGTPSMRPAQIARKFAHRRAHHFRHDDSFNEARANCAGNYGWGDADFRGRPPFNEARANCAGNSAGAPRIAVGRGWPSMRPAQIAREIA